MNQQEIQEEVINQDQQLNIWGISTQLRKNLVIGGYILLLSIISILWVALKNQEKETQLVNQDLVDCNKQISATIDTLRKEQIQMLNEFRKENAQIERDLDAAERQLLKLKQ
jgi:hypothetical protein